MKPVTDPAILAQLDGADHTPGKPVTDPALLAQLEGPAPQKKGFLRKAFDAVKRDLTTDYYADDESNRFDPAALKDAGGVAAGALVSGSMGVADVVTLGLSEPLTNKARKEMPNVGLTPNPIANFAGNLAGVLVPWAGVSKGVQVATGLNNLTRAGRVATQAATGGIVSGVTAQNSGEDAAIPALTGGLLAGIIGAAMEAPGVIKDRTTNLYTAQANEHDFNSMYRAYKDATGKKPVAGSSEEAELFDEMVRAMRSASTKNGKYVPPSRGQIHDAITALNTAKAKRIFAETEPPVVSPQGQVSSKPPSPISEPVPATKPVEPVVNESFTTAPTAKASLTVQPAAKPITDPALVAQLEAPGGRLPTYSPTVNQTVNLPQGFVLDTPQQTATPTVSAPLQKASEVPGVQVETVPSEMAAPANAQQAPETVLQQQPIQSPSSVPENQPEPANIQPQQQNQPAEYQAMSLKPSVDVKTLKTPADVFQSFRDGKLTFGNEGIIYDSATHETALQDALNDTAASIVKVRKNAVEVRTPDTRNENGEVVPGKLVGRFNLPDQTQAAAATSAEPLSWGDSNKKSAIVEGRAMLKRMSGADKEFAKNPVFQVVQETPDHAITLQFQSGRRTYNIRPEVLDIDQGGGLPSGDTVLKHGDTIRLSPGYLENKQPQIYLVPKGVEGAGGGNIFADTGGYNMDPPGAKNAPFAQQKVSALQLPEIAEIAKTLMGGEYPHIIRKLHKRGALGVFKAGTGSIDLLADLAKTPGLLERVLAHEVGHLVDWLPDHDINRGNILGRIASLKKYMGNLLAEHEGAPGVLSKKDRARLRREAEKELKANERPDETVIETITREVPQWKYTGIDSEMVKAIWNDTAARDKYPKLYRALSEMSDAEKKAVLVQAMKGLVHDRLSHMGERVQVGTDTITEEVSRTIPGVHATPEEISKRYAELVQEEIDKRNLYRRETISQELKDLTLHWKPFQPGVNPGYDAYRFSSVELYADAFSALLNDPAKVRHIAPTFEKAFMSYLNRKPEVSEVYYDIQQRMNNPEEVQQHRIDNLYSMFERGDAARNEMAKQKPIGESIKDTLMRGLWDEWHDTLKVIRQFEGQQTPAGRKAREARQALEELTHISSEGNQALYELQQAVMKPAEAAGITKKDIGAYMFAKRIISEEFKTVTLADGTTEQISTAKAASLGHTAETSRDLLKALESKWGADKFKEVERLVKVYRSWYEGVIDKARKEKLYTPELFDIIDENTDYSTNNIIDYLKKQLGRSVDIAQVFKRVGSLHDIENPLIATTQKALSVIRAVAINKAKRTTINILKEAGAATPADMTYSQDAGRNIPKEPKDPEQAIMIHMVDGKPEYHYIDRYIADSFKNDTVRAVALARFMSAISTPFRHLFVSKNPRWMVRNVTYDFKTTVKNNPAIGLTDIPALAMEYKRALPEVWREAHNKGRSAVISDLMENKAIPDHRVWEAKDRSFDDELDRLEASFSLDDDAARQSSKAARALMRAWVWLDNTGRASDLLGKVAYAKYMNRHHPTTPANEVHEAVRNTVGTPNIKRRGAWHQITNNLFMFSNVGKEGIRAAGSAFGKDRGAYIWKTLMMNILPSILKWGAIAGFAGPTVKKIMDRISGNDMRSSSIIPLYVDDNDKAHYIAIPQDYEGQYIGQAFDSLMHLQFGGKDGLLNVLKEAHPYQSLHPVLSLLFDYTQYYAMDINPMDSRGRNVLSDDQATAGGKYAAEGMLKHTWNSAGLSTLYRFSPDTTEADTSAMEKALKTFPVNTIGAYYKISDQGLKDRIHKAVEPVKKQEAAERILVRGAVKRIVEAKEPANLTKEEENAIGMHPDMLNRAIKMGTMHKQNLILLEALSRAGSQRQKAAIAESHKK